MTGRQLIARILNGDPKKDVLVHMGNGQCHEIVGVSTRRVDGYYGAIGLETFPLTVLEVKPSINDLTLAK